MGACGGGLAFAARLYNQNESRSGFVQLDSCAAWFGVAMCARGGYSCFERMQGERLGEQVI